MSDIYSLLREKWARQHLEVRPLEGELSSRHGPRLCEDYLWLLREVGVPDVEDADGFRFWQPSEIVSVSEVLRGAGYAHGPNADLAVVFADQMQESWWYALWLEGPRVGCVSLVLGLEPSDAASEPQEPVGSFREFLHLYLHVDERLFPS